MKEKILKYVQDNPYATFGNLCAIYDGRKNDLLLLINRLVEDGDLIKEDDTFLTPYNLGLIKAQIVSVKHHFAFASLADSEEEVMIEEKYLNHALLDDIVYLRYEVMFEVVKIVKRTRQDVVGEVIRQGLDYYLEVHGIATDATRFLLEDYEGEEDDIVKAEIVKSTKDKIIVKLKSKLGIKNAPGVDITRILLEHDCPIEFNEEVEEALTKIPFEVQKEELDGRKDLRDDFIVTIDGSDAKDLDDAVSAKRIKDGYLVGIHIADVSHYVQEYGAIDKEAFNRGTSIYVADRVVPMLPFMLSNGICSLNPHVDRLTLSCLVELDLNGQVRKSEIFPSVINSKHRLTYDYVNEVIENKKNETELEKQIQLLEEISLLLTKNKKERGELDLAIPELKVVVDEDGKAIGIQQRVQKEAEKVIENLMILANEQVAETIYKRNLPFIYRVHENPPAKRIDTLLSFVSGIGLKAHFNSLSVKPQDMQRLLYEAKGNEKYQILAQVLLRSLAKARYSTHNVGHFGLASTCYTHFTSPIRRYPDLIVHRYLRKYLFLKETENAYEKREELNYIAENTSMKERRAITVERESTDMKCAEYMQKYIGAEFTGYITGMNNSGLFVELENGVSGKVSFEGMSDYYFVDDRAFHAYGQRKGKRYSLGDKVEVIVTNTNKDVGEVYLQIKNEKGRPPRYNRKRRRN